MQYLRDKIAETIFTEIPKGAQKRVFENVSLGFVVGFEYDMLMPDYPPTSALPESFNLAYERGGDLIGRIFYLRDVTLRYVDSEGQQQETLVPYLLIQEKLTELGKKIEEIEAAAENFTQVDNLMGQFVELHKNMYRRGINNYDVKIAVNYGVDNDNKVRLMDTGGLSTGKTPPILTWYISLPYGTQTPRYEDISTETINELWETDLDSVMRSTFVNSDLEAPLKEIIKSVLYKAQLNQIKSGFKAGLIDDIGAKLADFIDRAIAGLLPADILNDAAFVAVGSYGRKTMGFGSPGIGSDADILVFLNNRDILSERHIEILLSLQRIGMNLGLNFAFPELTSEYKYTDALDAAYDGLSVDRKIMVMDGRFIAGNRDTFDRFDSIRTNHIWQNGDDNFLNGLKNETQIRYDEINAGNSVSLNTSAGLVDSSNKINKALHLIDNVVRVGRVENRISDPAGAIDTLVTRGYITGFQRDNLVSAQKYLVKTRSYLSILLDDGAAFDVSCFNRIFGTAYSDEDEIAAAIQAQIQMILDVANGLLAPVIQ